MRSDEFLIPSFVTGTKREWSNNHFVFAVSEFAWALNDEEREFSHMMRSFFQQVRTKALGSGGMAQPHGANKKFPFEYPKGPSENRAASG